MNSLRTLVLAVLLGLGAIIATSGEWAGNAQGERAAAGLSSHQRSVQSGPSGQRPPQDRFLFVVPPGSRTAETPEAPWNKD